VFVDYGEQLHRSAEHDNHRLEENSDPESGQRDLRGSNPRRPGVKNGVASRTVIVVVVSGWLPAAVVS
jgi:hypothetical protein